MSSPRTLIDHIRELRKRLFWSAIVYALIFCILLYFYTDIIAWFTKPFNAIEELRSKEKLFITSIFEGFVTEIRFCLITAGIVSLPYHIFNFLRFIFPGLKPREKSIILYSILASVFLSTFSFYLIYFKIIPYSIRFLMSSSFIPEGVGLILKFEQNLFYVLNFLLLSILVFHFPILLGIMLYLNIIKRKILLNWSRFIIVGIFVISAIVTPPDFVSLLGLALPLISLFYITLLIAKIFRFGEKS